MALLLALVLVLHCLCLEFCTSIDTITSTQYIEDPGTIVSNGNIFKLGFFSPINSTDRYVGVMFSISAVNVVWVANRDNPLNDSSGVLKISEDDGNLVVLNGQKEVIWSSNVPNSLANSSAQLLDSGNLVLRDNFTGRIIWESFQHPTDSFMQRMRLNSNSNTNENIMLRSWRSPSDPSVGSFSGGLVPLSIPQFFIWNGSHPYWRSGPWNGQIFIGIPGMNSVYLNGFILVDDRQGNIFLSFTLANESPVTYFVLNSDGILFEKDWNDGREDWEVTWSSVENECDVYGKCGPFGSCNSQDSPICTCLGGFEPRNIEEWSRGNWIGGCIRRTPLQCERNNSTAGKQDGFLRLQMMKVPDFAEWSPDLEDSCGSRCLSNCSCIAYAYDTGIGCMQWTRNLTDIQKFSNGGVDLYIRVSYLELDEKKNMTVVITITVIIGSVIIVACIYFYWKWMAIHRGRKQRSENTPQANMNQIKLEDLPLFSFEKLAQATNNFHVANKLGQGGFGPVYKGKLVDGKEIAVKRLSKSSEQGLEEFMNEAVVISRLQHRNLVRLIGGCVEEKMLIYEYMSNRSLDVVLFDSQKQQLLDWKKRVNIIQGIGRGLLYLHRDSRLRIIHRDLKASNILLDEELNPKISDFGMARIFGGNQDQANTRRIVGT